MSIFQSLQRQTFSIPCTIEIEHSTDSLHAHVELDGDFEIHPGDEVLVHDAPTEVAFGERVFVHRNATIVRAGMLERAWTRFVGHFELNELYEVSFSQRRKL